MKVILFSSPNCWPCRMVKPVIEQLSERYWIDMEYVNTKEEQQKTEEHEVTRVPTVVFEDHWLTVHSFTWAQKPEEIEMLFSQFAWK